MAREERTSRRFSLREQESMDSLEGSDEVDESMREENRDLFGEGPLSPAFDDTFMNLDYNQTFQKRKVQTTKSFLKETTRARYTIKQIEAQEKKIKLTHQQQLKQFYSSDYSSFKTSAIAFFYFFQFTTAQSRLCIELLEGCDNKKNGEVDLKEFGLRYCSSQKMLFFIIYHYFGYLFQGSFINSDGRLVREDGTKEDLSAGPNAGASLRRQQSLKKELAMLKLDNEENSRSGGDVSMYTPRVSLIQNSIYYPKDGQSSPFIQILTFLTHFLSVKPNDYVIYFHWLVTYGGKNPLSKKELTLILQLLHKDQQIHQETRDQTNPSLLRILRLRFQAMREVNLQEKVGLKRKKRRTAVDTSSGGVLSSSNSNNSGSSSNLGKFAKLIDSYLETIRDDNITSGQLRLIDSKLKGILSNSLQKLRRYLVQSTAPSTTDKKFWPIILEKMHALLYQQNLSNYYQKMIKQMRAEEVDLCDDFGIMTVRKQSEKALRKCLRYWKKYQQMLSLEAQSLSDLSGVFTQSVSATIYQTYCFPLLLRMGLTSGSDETNEANNTSEKQGTSIGGSSKVHPEINVESLQQLSILQGVEIAGGSLTGQRRRSTNKGVVTDFIRRMSGGIRLTRTNRKPNQLNDPNAKLEKVTFRALIAKPVIPSTEELQTLTVKVKRKAKQVMDEVDRLIDEIEHPEHYYQTVESSRNHHNNNTTRRRDSESDSSYSSEEEDREEGMDNHSHDDQNKEATTELMEESTDRMTPTHENNLRDDQERKEVIATEDPIAE